MVANITNRFALVIVAGVGFGILVVVTLLLLLPLAAAADAAAAAAGPFGFKSFFRPRPTLIPSQKPDEPIKIQPVHGQQSLT